MIFNARLSQDFTITADTKEAAEYALLYRVARYATMEGIDEKRGHYKAEAKAAKIDSLVSCDDESGASPEPVILVRPDGPSVDKVEQIDIF